MVSDGGLDECARAWFRGGGDMRDKRALNGQHAVCRTHLWFISK